jgi:hypothetical protein
MIVTSLTIVIGTVVLNNCSNSNNPASPSETITKINAALELKSFNASDSATQCDYLIITDSEFLDPALKLAEYRRTFDFDEVENPRVLLTRTIDSNYASYHHGLKISIIKAAICSVEINWKFKPKFIVLFADAQIKPRLYYAIPIPDSSLFADLYYADIDSNNHPEVILGRIAVSTKQEADDYVMKVKTFESNSVHTMQFITDDHWQGILHDALDFNQSNQIISSYLAILPAFNLLLKNFLIVNFSSTDSLPLNTNPQKTANRALIDSLNLCNKVVTFLGHANHQFLTDEHLLTVYDLEKLKTIDFWVSLGCNSNEYSFEDSFAKELLRMPNAGAVAFIAPYLVGYQSSGERMICAFYKYLFSSTKKYSAGEAFLIATREQNWSPSGGYFVYLGDPAIVVRH